MIHKFSRRLRATASVRFGALHLNVMACTLPFHMIKRPSTAAGWHVHACYAANLMPLGWFRVTFFLLWGFCNLYIHAFMAYVWVSMLTTCASLRDSLRCTVPRSKSIWRPKTRSTTPTWIWWKGWRWIEWQKLRCGRHVIRLLLNADSSRIEWNRKPDEKAIISKIEYELNELWKSPRTSK